MAIKASEVVKYLNEHVISQDDAKKQLAVLIKNKERYEKIQEEDWKRNVTPFNALIIGPTGSGKTELFRKLAEYLNVAFCKVDISSYTKTGYVGKSVDEIINVHLYEAAKKKAIEEMKEELKDEIMDKVDKELAAAYVEEYKDELGLNNQPNTILGAAMFTAPSEDLDAINEEIERTYEKIKKEDPEILEKEVTVTRFTYEIPKGLFVQGPAKEQFKVRKVFTDKIKELRKLLFDMDIQEAVEHNSKLQKKIREYMENGIVFIDEIDKIAGKESGRIESAGVQKELLTLVEGTTIQTEIGPVNTDHILFIAAGAFHTAKPTDLLPELLGRFPIRITLRKLTKDDLRRILVEPKYSIIKKIQKIYEQDNIQIEFTDDALDAIAEYADRFNNEDEHLGARRLHSLIAMITEDIDFEIEEGKWKDNKVIIDRKYVEDKINTKKEKIEKALEYIQNESGKKIGFVV